MPKCDFNKVASKFIEIALPHGFSPVNLLDIFKTPFPKNASGQLYLELDVTMTITRNCMLFPVN